MLANVGRYDRFAFGRLMNHLDDPLRLQLGIRIHVSERISQLRLLATCARHASALAARFSFLVRNLQNGLHIANDRNIRRHVFADLRRIDVDMDDLRFRSKAGQLPVTRSSNRAPILISRSAF